MKTKLPLINTLLLMAILAYLVVNSVNIKDESKEAYVLTNELFSSFDYAIELDAEFTKVKDGRMKELNTEKQALIRLEQRIIAGKSSEEESREFQLRYSNLQGAELALNQELAMLNQEYSQKVWEKLTAFTKEFGEANDYEVIFGADGNGNIMHASEDRNITKELIAFCNEKYGGQ